MFDCGHDSHIGNFTASVNGQLTGRYGFPQRSIYRFMDSLKRVLDRIERRLKVVGLTANAASKAAGKPDAIQNIRRAVETGDRKGVALTTLASLAPILRTTVAWLTEGTGPEDTEDGAATIPVWGKAGAGGRVYRFHEGTEIGRIPKPDDADDRTAAVEIEGESLGETFNGWYAIYDEVRDPPTTDLIGELCVVEDASGHVYIKKLKKGRGKRFILVSDFAPPIYDVEIKWAARVKNMVPK